MNTCYVIDTGSANRSSVAHALARAGLEVRPVSRPDQVARAARVVLPGVGSFGSAMRSLQRQGLVEPLRDRIARRRPLFAICVGLQLLARSSEESPEVEGLGWIEAEVRGFDGEVRVPHMGWNHVTARRGSFASGYAYFANSYRVDVKEIGRTFDGLATCRWSGEFVAALASGAVWATQFHPELSGPWGAALVARWVQSTQEAAAC